MTAPAALTPLSETWEEFAALNARLDGLFAEFDALFAEVAGLERALRAAAPADTDADAA